MADLATIADKIELVDEVTDVYLDMEHQTAPVQPEGWMLNDESALSNLNDFLLDQPYMDPPESVEIKPREGKIVYHF